jgi:HPt (histidine-containing phosphotransfer) domain-containing protein
MALNHAALDELRSLDPDGSAGILAQIINVYLGDAPKLIANIQAALAAKDIATMTRHAHSLKSASLSVGASRVGEIASSIESGGRKNNVDDCPALLMALSAEYSAAKQLLQAEIPAPGKLA